MIKRYHVANTNRMVSPDTIVPDPTNPQSYNRYSYVNNRPLSLIDPSGHCGEDPFESYVNECETLRNELQNLYSIPIEGSWKLAEMQMLAEVLKTFLDWAGGDLDTVFQGALTGIQIVRANADGAVSLGCYDPCWIPQSQGKWGFVTLVGGRGSQEELQSAAFHELMHAYIATRPLLLDDWYQFAGWDWGVTGTKGCFLVFECAEQGWKSTSAMITPYGRYVADGGTSILELGIDLRPNAGHEDLAEFTALILNQEPHPLYASALEAQTYNLFESWIKSIPSRKY